MVLSINFLLDIFSKLLAYNYSRKIETITYEYKHSFEKK